MGAYLVALDFTIDRILVYNDTAVPLDVVITRSIIVRVLSERTEVLA